MDDPRLPDATQYSVVIDTADFPGATPVAAIVETWRQCPHCGDAMAYEGIPGQ